VGTERRHINQARAMKQLILLLILVTGVAQATLPEAGLSNSDQIRFHRICRTLIAPCCWSQPVDVHLSPAADQARTEVAAMIRAGKSDRQILDSFIERYGERILAEPEGTQWIVLTTVPILTLLFGTVVLGWFLSRHRTRGGTGGSACPS
jgi:cytochrome c-type biogenesis protein CcmH